jgi:hypothetical protein
MSGRVDNSWRDEGTRLWARLGVPQAAYEHVTKLGYGYLRLNDRGHTAGLDG